MHYLLVVAFLRGSTNPPPETWFARVETWTKAAREEGVVVTVPQDAQQALLFLAPETGAGSIRCATQSRKTGRVRQEDIAGSESGQPGSLAPQEHLDDVKETSDTDPAEVHERSVLLARTLNIKLDSQCFDKPTEQQGPCLTEQHRSVDFGRCPQAQTMVTALTSGPSSDLIGTASTAPVVGGGYETRMWAPWWTWREF